MAVGTESGAIVVQDVNSQKQQILSNNVHRPITALAYVAGSLYSAQSGSISKWASDLSKVESSFKCESKKNSITQILEQKENLICASRKIKCYVGGEMTHEWSGHSTVCSAMTSAGDFLVSYGQDEKSVAVWKENIDQTECRFQLTRR